MKDHLTCPEYEELKRHYINGWKTWNVHSVFSYVHMPDGLALGLHMKEYRDGNFLRDALIGRFASDDPEDATEVLFPGEHAVDDSYTSMEMEWCGARVRVETACDDDRFALLVTELVPQKKPLSLYLSGGYLWNRPGRVWRSGGCLRAESGTADADDCLCAENRDSSRGIWCIETSGGIRLQSEAMEEAEDVADVNVPLTGPYLSLKLRGQAAFLARRAGSGKCGPQCDAQPQHEAQPPEGPEGSGRAEQILQEVRALTEQKKQALAKRYSREGNLEWACRAAECAIAWDTVYDAVNNRVISPVSRLWSIRKGGYVLFCWDNFFAGYLAGYLPGTAGKEVAYSNVIEIVNERTPKGFVPNMSCGNGQKTLDRSQPPVGSRMVLELYRKYEDLWLVELLYPALLKWNTWFYENRKHTSGAFCWGSDPAPVLFGNRWEIDGVNGRFGGSLESGMDNSPLYDDIPFDTQTNCLKLEDVGLTGLYIMDCGALAKLAQLLGKSEDIRLLETRKKEVSKGLEQLWDEERGFYYNRRTDTGEFSRRIAPTNFYALFADGIPSGRLERIIREHYYNPEEFYGDWMLPSIARNDPAFADQEYWRGRVWAPLNFLVYLAFEQQHLTEACSDLAKKSAAIFLPEWQEKRHVHENYNSITGEGCDVHSSDRFYHWGALMASIVLRDSADSGRKRSDI